MNSYYIKMLTQDEKDDVLNAGEGLEPSSDAFTKSPTLTEAENKSCFPNFSKQIRQFIFLGICACGTFNKTIIGMILQAVAAGIVMGSTDLGFGYAFSYTVGWQFLLIA